MPRVKRGVTARARHKKVLALAKGYRGRRKNVVRIAKQAVMPKMKTKKSAAKRLVVRPGGTVKRGQAFKRHILTKKTTKNKRHLRGTTGVFETDMKSVTRMLPYA